MGGDDLDLATSTLFVVCLFPGELVANSAC